MVSKKPLCIGFFSAKNCLDRNTFSGTLYYMQKALRQRHLELVNLGTPEYPFLKKKLLDRVIRRRGQPLSEMGSQQYITKQTEFAYRVQKQLLSAPCDVIFAPVASDELSCFENIPIVYLSDVIFQLYRAHYPIHFNERECTWKEKQERSAIFKRLVFSVYSFASVGG